MSKGKVSILGCGRVGVTLGRELAQAGFSVMGSTTSQKRFAELEEAGITPVELSLSPAFTGNPDDIRRFLNVDVLVVAMAPTGTEVFTYEDQLRAASEAAAEAGIKQVIFTGATFIYPSNNCEVREDDVDPDNCSFMGTDWLKIEQAIASGAPERTTILRLAGLMGEGHNPAHYFSGRPMAGANDPVNMIHQDDVAGVIHAVIDQGIVGEVFNVAAPEHPSRRDFYMMASEKAGVAPPLFEEDARPYRLVNCDKLNTRLGYTFRYPDPLTAV
ncbi:NAD(P)H-binding protein [Parendozoicomonas haliclonae]|uniref:NAD(P)-binding domain-containing protein n=1 Tax=Parendozoicomonas haliclonae TaxID=1960125 RepID=A0A1X7AFS9_9GAMM|nr:NAD(P)H-binding protein [Parendozoicomonas haliclonae]SMA38548.1 hypothetical protein EHSB41UT_00889 [Parendozoicomonas haliclonae]